MIRSVSAHYVFKLHVLWFFSTAAGWRLHLRIIHPEFSASFDILAAGAVPLTQASRCGVGVAVAWALWLYSRFRALADLRRSYGTSVAAFEPYKSLSPNRLLDVMSVVEIVHLFELA